MSSKPALVCSRCGAPAEAGAAACPRCSGKLLRICGACSGQNSPGKNYCDHCGAPLAAPQAAETSLEPSKEPAAPADKTLRLPVTGVIRTIPESPSASPKPDSAPPKRSAHSERFRNQTEAPHAGVPPAEAGSPGPARRSAPAGTTFLRRERRWAVYSLALGLLLLAAGGGLYAWRWRREGRPEARLLKAAARYLEAMRTRDYAGAYGMLSAETRAQTPLPEFQAAQASADWSFSDLQIVSMEGDSAVVRYTLTTQGQEPSEHVLSFLDQGGRWAHPWAWNLFDRVEDALDQSDPSGALKAAQAAVAVDPKDPLSHAYLCEAAYADRAPEAAARECRTAVDLDAHTASAITPQTRAYLHEVLADTLKNALRRWDEAAREYTILLGAPGLAPEAQCRWLLARGECYAASGNAADALKDFQSAVCTDPMDRADQLRAINTLSGSKETP